MIGVKKIGIEFPSGANQRLRSVPVDEKDDTRETITRVDSIRLMLWFLIDIQRHTLGQERLQII